MTFMMINRRVRRVWHRLRRRGFSSRRYIVRQSKDIQSSMMFTTSGAIWLIMQGFVAEVRRNPNAIADPMSMEIEWVMHPRNLFTNEAAADEFMGAVEFLHAMDRQFTRSMLRYAKIGKFEYNPLTITRDQVVDLINTSLVRY